MFLNRSILFFTCCLFVLQGWIQAELQAGIDLEEHPSEFIVQTKKITIPGYPDAFNPSITRWRGHLLLSFRARDPLTRSTNLVGFVWLDEQFKMITEPQLLEIYHNTQMGDYLQDPRLIVIDEKLYIVFSNIWKQPYKDVRRVFVSEVQHDGKRFYTKNPDVFLVFEGDESNKFEKNWVPFEYNRDLLLAYSIIPHKIFLPVLGTKKCKTVALSEQRVNWKWGDLRGGTTAQLVDGQYLAFFHSSKVMRSVQSNNEEMPHYFMGAYTFEAYPPFQLKSVSTRPIIGKKFYSGPSHETWKPLRVVFPCGFVYNDKYIWVAYGRQDHEVWIVKLDKKALLESLSPVH